MTSLIIAVASIISSMGVIITLILTFINPGRFKILRPARLTLLQVKTKETTKDALIVPFAVSNSSSFDKTVILCIVVRMVDKNRRTTADFEKGRPVVVMTNDLEIDGFSYTELLKRKEDEWVSEKLDLQYKKPFISNSRSTSQKDCVFMTIDKVVTNPFTEHPKQRLEFDLYTRKNKHLSSRKMEKLRNEIRKSELDYEEDFIHSYGGEFSLWKPVFRINWRTPEKEKMDGIKNGGALTVTRFETAKIHFWERSLHKDPLLLLSEET